MRTEEITKSMATAYIDSTINSNLAYRPEFVSNDYRQGNAYIYDRLWRWEILLCV